MQALDLMLEMDFCLISRLGILFHNLALQSVRKCQLLIDKRLAKGGGGGGGGCGITDDDGGVIDPDDIDSDVVSGGSM
ncbi:hypothetical protein DERF_014288 [Dermatophagoides farinae]|uniref:Uncharacterized protein n=1 Tax=Dermatophagoides farinae TaxID=6954 RepID=A0A922HLK6_DERFA|nr:hypothetical protein DERF_014288 [Dermatophagoides farinae]